MGWLKTHKRSLLLLSLLLLIKFIWAFYAIKSGYIPLNPDEAQYWTWSRYLDFGFYSKPPGIAWQIWLGCKLFGQNELGIRFFSVIFSTLTAYAIYLLAYVSKAKPKLCFWSAIILTLSPIGMMGTFAATTDVGFIFFWTLALIPVLYALMSEKPVSYILVGCCILLGSLFKWPIYVLWPLFALAFLVYRPLYNASFYKGVLISLGGLLPSIIWNATHEWATFKHVFTQSAGRTANSNFWDFFGAQFGVLSPIFFLLFLLALLEILKVRKKVSKALLFCAYISSFILITFLYLSSQKKIQANWALYAYPSSTLLIAWYALEQLKKGTRWLNIGAAFSLVLVSFFISIPKIQEKALFSKKVFPYRINPFRHSLGWSQMAKELKEIPYDQNENFFFADSYQTTSLLSFYGPEQKRQYFLNLSHKRKNQFSFWPSMAQEQVGKTGYYVWADNSKNFLKDFDYKKNKAEELLKPYFSKVEFIRLIPLFTSHGELVKGALVFRCENYNGKMPVDPNSY